MKMISHDAAAKALGITPKKLLALCVEGAPHNYARSGRTYNLQAVTSWLAKRSAARAAKLDPVAEAAKLLDITPERAREFLEARAGTATPAPRAEAERATYLAEMDQRMGLVGFQAGAHACVTSSDRSGRTVAFNSHKPADMGAVESRLRAAEMAAAPEPAPQQESAAARDERRRTMDARMGLHKGGVRKEGNALILSPTFD